MLKPVFSTVACPDWTIREVASRALACGFEAVELRTFGDASREFACDPALTAEEKTRRMLLEAGVEPLCLASGVRFDEPIFPPVIGLFSPDRERSVREGKRAIDLAVGLECPYVRVFGFEIVASEKRPSAMARICDRLKMAVDHADKSGVRVVIENGGSFETAAQLMEVIERVNHSLLGACYSVAVGHAAGEDPVHAIDTLGARLWVARVKDLKDGRPCLLGEGSVPCERFARELIARNFSGPLVFEWDRAWVPGLASAEEALKAASRTMYGWMGADSGAAAGRSPVIARR